MKMDMSRPASEEELAELNDSPYYRTWNVADYSHWVLRLNAEDQGLPGRMVVWLKRHVDCMPAWKLSPEEREEFYGKILPDIASAIHGLRWPLVRLNHEWLTNRVDHHRGHGHYHVTPRYFEPFEVSGRTFRDLDTNTRRKTPELQLPVGEMVVLRDLFRSVIFRNRPSWV
jgi:hypothetical protein